MQHENAMAEIETHFVVDQLRRCNEAHVLEQRIAHRLAQCFDIMRTTFRQRARQVFMVNENDAGGHECCIAKNMMGMFVLINYVAHGLVGDGFDGLQKTSSDAHAVTRVYDRNCLVANDETHIRKVAEAGCVHDGDGA